MNSKYKQLQDRVCHLWSKMDIPEVGSLLLNSEPEYDEMDIISFFKEKKFDIIFERGDIEMMPFYYLSSYASCYYLGGYFLYLLDAFKETPQPFPYRFSNHHLARYMASEKILEDASHLDLDRIDIVKSIYQYIIYRGKDIDIGIEDELVLSGLKHNLEVFTRAWPN